MARDEKRSASPRYKYHFGLKAMLQDGKTVNTHDDIKDNVDELVHFIVQNSNYRYDELMKMNIDVFLKIFSFVEKDIQRKIAQSKK